MSRAIRNIEQRNQSIQQFFQPGMQAIHQASIEADKRNAQLKKADARANRNLKVPMAPNNTAKLQDELWRKGAFKGIKDRRGRELTYEQAVDGIMGNMTRQAMANAEAMTPVAPETPKPQNRKNGLANMYGMTHAAATGGMSNLPSSSKDPIASLYHRYIDNLYPYGYSDNEGKDTLWGAVKKATKGFAGRSDKKSAVDEFVELDLKDPAQRKRALELRKQFSNFSSNDLNYIQQGMRARLDANSLWANQPQRWNTWIENPDYQSATARAAGAKTYTYKDPVLRKRQQQLALQYSKQQSANGVYSVKNDVLNTFNNYSINRMHDDGSGRYLEKWDFMGVDIPGGKGVYIGDTIPANVGGRGTFVKEGDDLSLAALFKNQFKKE